ncbi:nitroreductase family protein [Streptomyces sp. NRRL S-813]|uniref:nitroreductase family protein n=1 Tax=Streptomyces sp. NRRL S-813 TaxID=1463919 RepID=UPI001F4536FB|nr:nitroreductase family protein [Streptomyces sp. NRRL S-813]
MDASAAAHGYTLALLTATAMTSSDRGAPGTAEVLALLAGATLAFVGLGAVAYGGSPMKPERSAPAGTWIRAAFHLPMAALAALVSLLLAWCCSGPVLWGSRDDHDGCLSACCQRPVRAVRERSARLNALLEVGYFIIGVPAAGLAAGPMTGFDTEGIDKEFFSDGEHSVLAVVNIGRPGETAWFPRSPRLTYAQVVTTV